MKKILFLPLFLLGCTARPEYYSHSQNIVLEGITPHTTLYYQNNLIPSESEKGTLIPKEESINLDQNEYKISRSWDDQELIIKKVGFKDYHLKLDSSMTDEPWATAEYATGGRHYFPSLGLLFPMNTVKEVVSVPVYLLMSILSAITISPVSLSMYLTKTGISLVNIPGAVVSDVYDIISVPGTAIVNPWTKFQYNPVVILEPTEALKRECSSQQNTFISNNGCVKCFDNRVILYSSEEECNKCSNRRWNNGQCQIRNTN